MVQDMDHLITVLGSPGRYQLIVFLLLFFNYFQVAFNHVCMAFFGSVPSEFHCVPEHGYGVGGTDAGVDVCIQLNQTSNVTSSCTSWNYSAGLQDREWTIVTQWDLVCSDKSLPALATTIYFLGVMVGGIFFGFLADALGRLPMLIVCMYAPMVIGVVIYFVTTYVQFVVLRFIQGVLIQGLQITTVSILMEFSLPKHRSLVGCILELYWGGGVLLVALIAFLARDWRIMQLTMSVPTALTITYIWLIPESLRWLISTGKFSRAENLIKRICKFNKIQDCDKILTLLRTFETKESDAKKKKYTLIDLMRHPVLRKRTLVLWYIWFSVSLGYYGLVLSSTSLFGSKYMNFSIGAILEFCAYAAAIAILYYFGRRIPLMAYFLFGGIACIIAGAIPADTDSKKLAKTALSLVGRFGLAGAFSVVFLFTSELYPTIMRNIGLGSCTFWTRVGGVVAPQINLLKNVTYAGTPPIIFGILAVIGGFLSLMLPETLNRKLPDTIEEAADIQGNAINRGVIEQLEDIHDVASAKP